MIRFFGNILEFILRCIGIKLNRQQRMNIDQFIKFGVVGCSNAGISLVVYYIFILINPNLYIVGNTLGYIAGIFNSFYWNKKVVFTDSAVDEKRAFVRMFLCYGATYFLQSLLIFLFVEKIYISKLIAPIIVILIVTPVNFIINKIWSFK